MAHSLAVERRTAKTRTLTTSHNTDVSKQCLVPKQCQHQGENTAGAHACQHKPTYCVRTAAILGGAVTARGYSVGGLPGGWRCPCFLSWVLEMWRGHKAAHSSAAWSQEGRGGPSSYCYGSSVSAFPGASDKSPPIQSCCLSLHTPTSRAEEFQPENVLLESCAKEACCGLPCMKSPCQGPSAWKY